MLSALSATIDRSGKRGAGKLQPSCIRSYASASTGVAAGPAKGLRAVVQARPAPTDRAAVAEAAQAERDEASPRLVGRLFVSDCVPIAELVWDEIDARPGLDRLAECIPMLEQASQAGSRAAPLRTSGFWWWPHVRAQRLFSILPAGPKLTSLTSGESSSFCETQRATSLRFRRRRRTHRNGRPRSRRLCWWSSSKARRGCPYRRHAGLEPRSRSVV